jgi:hypothetical protein
MPEKSGRRTPNVGAGRSALTAAEHGDAERQFWRAQWSAWRLVLTG